MLVNQGESKHIWFTVFFMNKYSPVNAPLMKVTAHPSKKLKININFCYNNLMHMLDIY